MARMSEESLSEFSSAVAVLRRAVRGEIADPVLFVVAHPDDEIMGAAVTMSRLARPMVLHVTNGVPQSRELMSRHFTGTAEEYGAVRSFEARCALRLAGIRSDAVRTLGCGDFEAAFDIAAIAREVADAFVRLEPAVVVTHAYEGGHPDHDAVAAAVHGAAELARRSGRVPPLLAEMPLFHAREGRFVAGEFCDQNGASDSQIMTIALDARERDLKRRMFECLATQSDLLAHFPIGIETFRDAPQYDFASPPHDGPLRYEVLGWPIDGELWRHLAAGALQQFGVAAGSCL